MGCYDCSWNGIVDSLLNFPYPRGYELYPLCLEWICSGFCHYYCLVFVISAPRPFSSLLHTCHPCLLFLLIFGVALDSFRGAFSIISFPPRFLFYIFLFFLAWIRLGARLLFSSWRGGMRGNLLMLDDAYIGFLFVSP